MSGGAGEDENESTFGGQPKSGQGWGSKIRSWFTGRQDLDNIYFTPSDDLRRSPDVPRTDSVQACHPHRLPIVIRSKGQDPQTPHPTTSSNRRQLVGDNKAGGHKEKQSPKSIRTYSRHDRHHHRQKRTRSPTPDDQFAQTAENIRSSNDIDALDFEDDLSDSPPLHMAGSQANTFINKILEQRPPWKDQVLKAHRLHHHEESLQIPFPSVSPIPLTSSRVAGGRVVDSQTSSYPTPSPQRSPSHSPVRAGATNSKSFDDFDDFSEGSDDESLRSHQHPFSRHNKKRRIPSASEDLNDSHYDGHENEDEIAGGFTQEHRTVSSQSFGSDTSDDVMEVEAAVSKSQAVHFAFCAAYKGDSSHKDFLMRLALGARIGIKHEDFDAFVICHPLYSDVAQNSRPSWRKWWKKNRQAHQPEGCRILNTETLKACEAESILLWNSAMRIRP